ncbi:MAG: acyl carrier protein [Desulforhopalus sp.]|jgi:acyl carrier protein
MVTVFGDSIISFEITRNCVVSAINRKNYQISCTIKPIMTRDEFKDKILTILVDDFEFEQPGLEDNLRDDHGFDSIDAIELLGKIEIILGYSISRDDKEKAMGIRTINDILDYIEKIQQSHTK